MDRISDASGEQSGTSSSLEESTAVAARDQQDEDLSSSLLALSTLSSTDHGLEGLLAEIATMASHAVASADGVGLTLEEPDRTDLVVKSAEFVQAIDDLQYSIGEGPCITAAATGETIISGSLGGDRRWPRFGARASRLGVHSVLSVPLRARHEIFGAFNFYAHAKNAFDDRSAELAEIFAGPAAVSVSNAHLLAQSQRLTANLQIALRSRPVIDQAIGILRSRSGDTAAEAFTRLRVISQTEHRKLHDVADMLVEEAAARARARRRSTGVGIPDDAGSSGD